MVVSLVFNNFLTNKRVKARTIYCTFVLSESAGSLNSRLAGNFYIITVLNVFFSHKVHQNVAKIVNEREFMNLKTLMEDLMNLH